MGNKYTVEAGKSNYIEIQFGTEWFIIALLKLFTINVNNRTIYWKRLTVR